MDRPVNPLARLNLPDPRIGAADRQPAQTQPPINVAELDRAGLELLLAHAENGTGPAADMPQSFRARLAGVARRELERRPAEDAEA